jgi:diguanylate cyclase with GGDEF domain
MLVAERVRAVIADARLPHPSAPGGHLTVSIGVADAGQGIEDRLAAADAALYEAKRSGRDRVLAAGDRALAATATIAAPEKREGCADSPETAFIAQAGDDAVAVLESVARTIRSDLRFATVVGNLRISGGHEVRIEVVLGDDEARTELLHATNPWSEWDEMIGAGVARHGAIWLPAGSHQWGRGVTSWMPSASARPVSDAWQREDALLLPLRDRDNEILAIVAVDEPLNGRRPTDAEIGALMAVAERGATLLQQLSDALGTEADLDSVSR